MQTIILFPLILTIWLAPTTTDAFVVQPSSAKRSVSLNLNPLIDVPLDDIANAYEFALENFQIPTQSVTSGVLCGVGDAIAQAREGDDEEEEVQKSISLDRVSRFFIKGLGGGIIWSAWYGINQDWTDTITMDLALSNPMAEQAIKTLTSVALEQFVACPIIYAIWDIPVPGLLSGTSPKDIVPQVQGKIGGLLWENAKVWTFVNLIVYNIPLQFRVLFMSVCDVFWQSVISETVAADLEEKEVPSRVISTSLLKKSN